LAANRGLLPAPQCNGCATALRERHRAARPRERRRERRRQSRSSVHPRGRSVIQM